MSESDLAILLSNVFWFLLFLQERKRANEWRERWKAESDRHWGTMDKAIKAILHHERLIDTGLISDQKTQVPDPGVFAQYPREKL